MGELWNDIKHALHLFVKSPGFTIAAVAALAFGQGHRAKSSRRWW